MCSERPPEEVPTIHSPGPCTSTTTRWSSRECLVCGDTPCISSLAPTRLHGSAVAIVFLTCARQYIFGRRRRGGRACRFFCRRGPWCVGSGDLLEWCCTDGWS